MDIADIGKVANRKRLNVEAEKLREKVSRETEKIIKLKVFLINFVIYFVFYTNGEVRTFNNEMKKVLLAYYI